MSNINGEYSALDEVMYYYHYNFYAYYFLLSIVLINCIKVIMDYIHIVEVKRLEQWNSI
ncbi:hypothetical protein KQI88_03445 [Alkaliphilus sp. MSJ-5]|uniref:Uncharacterized protein n=1 Tax=Alkaliphilus flagellatus TaxID=2841507 RepID=A0ABS6FZG5_9FIRM|nr:hypothetical protein [Alkaliphilus flagellatus]MBU5675468.1 hypothetical protein [Alkaliphilus flagellatus]